MKNKLKVAIANFPPLIMEDGGRYEGFEIDLWEAIAKEIKADFEYEKHEFEEIIPLLAKNKLDVGLAGITITEKREKIIDFSHSTLDSGLLISVNKNRNKPRFFKTIKTIIVEGNKIITSAAISVVIFLIVFGNLLWFAEGSADTFSKSYFPGIFESFWLVICSMSTDSFGDYVPQTWWGRIVITGIIVGGVAIFGLLIGQISAFLAVRKIKGDINSSRDLVNKPTGTVGGTISETVVKKIGARMIRFLNIEEAFKKLGKEEIDAVVFDAPVIIYSEKNNKDSQVEIVGELFDKQKYGIALQNNSPIREKVNQAILNLKESGQYDVFYKKWFGDDLIMEG